MALPTLYVGLALSGSPFSGAAETSVSSLVCGRISIKRGRTGVLGEIQPGVATLTLLNTSRDFDPMNTSGTYAPDIVPMVPISIGATWSAVTYILFSGYVTAWNPRYEGGGLAYADLECVDAFEAFSRLRLGTTAAPLALAAATTVDRVIDVLDEIGWPGSGASTGPRDLDTSALTSLQASSLENVPVLEHLQRVMHSESGLFFIGANGDAVLQRRTYRDTATSVGTWGDAAAGSELPYARLDTSLNLDQVYNRVELQREGGAEQIVDDATSQLLYLPRTLARTGLLNTGDVNVASIAADILARQKDPKLRAERMVIDPTVRDTWADVLPRDISTRLVVNRQTLLGGSAMALDAFIEGVQHDITITPAESRSWRTTWNLSSL